MNKRQQILTQLLKLLPEAQVISDAAGLKPYECDGLSAYKQQPWLVVLPEQISQVQQIMRWCDELEIPVIARGAGTGLAAGVLPSDGALILSLAKLTKIKQIEAQARYAVVEPGVRNLAISQAVAMHNLYYAPDPSSQIACTIGGNVAENSGGVHCLKYGLTVHNVLAVKIVTMQGELLQLGGLGLDSPGYDLLALINGSEGLLGVIVEVTVKLLVQPPAAKVVMAAFKQVQQAGNAVAQIIAQGIIPAGLEMMDALAIQAAEDFVHVGYPRDAAALLLCEVDGHEIEIDEQVTALNDLFKQLGAYQIVSSNDEAHRMSLWQGRKSAFPAVGRLAPDYYCMDGTIPKRHLADILMLMNKLSDNYGLAVANVFHAGDGNLHPLILYNANTPGELKKAEDFGAEILAACVEMGGAITGEHGVGKEKIDSMCVQFNPDELATFHRVKNAFDEKALLNPGKAVPTLHRCAELGAMHVHKGQLPHPELDRF